MRTASIAVIAILAGVPALAKDPFGRPELPVPASATKLQVAFADTTSWNGRRVPRTMQCARLGGLNPASPELKVAGVPDATKSLVVYVVNVRNYDNHGLMRFTGERDGAAMTIPAVRSLSADLPKGVELFDGGSQSGFAYAAPCPGSGGWNYAITVYALGEKDAVLAVGELSMGFAP